MEFIPFPKIARLSRACVITEKIDGTNAQVYIRELPDDEVMPTETPIVAVRGNLLIYAGSRNRWLLPGKPQTRGGQTTYSDNFGFAAWVEAHADELAALGPGRHFGEWWGSGIQRGYGLAPGHRRFSLFNVSRWHSASGPGPFVTFPANPALQPTYSVEAPTCCDVVPVLLRDDFDVKRVERCLESLRVYGSEAAPGFMQPEGVVVFHTAAGHLYKKTLDQNDRSKNLPTS